VLVVVARISDFSAEGPAAGDPHATRASPTAITPKNLRMLTLSAPCQM
jgi:hypothetical protein